MKISIMGLGYVGCVSAACLAHDGHKVVGVDVNAGKVELVNSGRSPIVEPGLDRLIEEVVRRGDLRASDDYQAAVCDSDLTLICVGTPGSGNGSLKLQYVESVCREIGIALAAKSNYHVVVVRSTVLPGSVEEKLIPIIEQYSGRRAGVDFGVCMNPEFLREGSAIDDYLHPSLVVIGQLDQRSGDFVHKLYESLDASIVRTSIRNAEMEKYVCNAFHALKIVFANEIGNLCKAQGIDGREVMEIFCEDRQLNLSPAYLKPGFAFGGSCLPKDLRALLYRAKELDVATDLLRATLTSNREQVEIGLRLIEKQGCKKIGILGLSFKANTDDLRESSSVVLAEILLGRGYQVMIFDDKVQLSRLVGANKSFIEKELPHIASLMCSSIDELLERSEVVVITNRSEHFSAVPMLIRERQALVDLAGIVRDGSAVNGTYEGICW